MRTTGLDITCLRFDKAMSQNFVIYIFQNSTFLESLLSYDWPSVILDVGSDTFLTT